MYYRFKISKETYMKNDLKKKYIFIKYYCFEIGFSMSHEIVTISSVLHNN